MKKHRQYDYAILVLEDTPGLKYGFLGMDAREEKLSKNNELEIAGFPNKIEKFMVTSKNKGRKSEKERLIYHLVTTCKGQSGSPIINSEGMVVGIHTGQFKGEMKKVGVVLN